LYQLLTELRSYFLGQARTQDVAAYKLSLANRLDNIISEYKDELGEYSDILEAEI
jgi:hypothetical protein